MGQNHGHRLVEHIPCSPILAKGRTRGGSYSDMEARDVRNRARKATR